LGIVFPTFFSPEGNGTNDHWYPTRTEDYPDLEVSVLDKYQRLIAKFKGNNQLGWDGTLIKGNHCLQGTIGMLQKLIMTRMIGNL
jgi:gliding motility-associated-like protein